MTTPILPRPTADEVIRAEKKFDEEYGPTEWVLTQLFQKFRENTDFGEVVVKTKVLNVLYAANVLAVNIVARHICSLAIDAALKAGNPEIVDKISKVQFSGDKIRHYFAFASKYCSWHNPTAYPIYDGNVEACLWCYKRQDGFATFARSGYGYPEFVRRVNAFRDFYGLASFSYKQLDKFLWSLGETVVSRAKAQPCVSRVLVSDFLKRGK
jgi:hypothetical protein